MTVLTERILLPGMTITRRGAAVDLLDLAQPFGKAGMVIHGSSFDRSGGLARLQASRPADMAVYYHLHDSGEPTGQHLEALVRLAEQQDGIRWVMAIGGGSVLDLAKSVAEANQTVGRRMPV